MRKKKGILVACVSICVLLLVAGVMLLQPKEEMKIDRDKPVTLEQAKKQFATDIKELKSGKYENLISKEFESSIESVQGVYNLEVLVDNSFTENTFLENLSVMETAIEKFFGKDIDKSFLEAEIYLSNTESELVKYDQIEEAFASGRMDQARGTGWLYGKDPVDSKWVQTGSGLLHTWFSKCGLDTIHPSAQDEYKEVYPYFGGLRQEDAVLHLKDKNVLLSEMEESVLHYMNSDKFPLIKGTDIFYGIGEARIIENDKGEAICFLVRRMYKGLPFEYGSNSAGGAYIDSKPHDGGEITYVESSSPDTMLGFWRSNGAVVEKAEISEMITAGKALDLLSERIGGNSVYEVRGVELVYRNCEVPEDKIGEISDILEPKWKIITVNQNDDKYTLFYVDVVTGEITDRFEYYYD